MLTKYLETSCVPLEMNLTFNTEFICPSKVYENKYKRYYEINEMTNGLIETNLFRLL